WMKQGYEARRASEGTPEPSLARRAKSVCVNRQHVGCVESALTHRGVFPVHQRRLDAPTTHYSSSYFVAATPINSSTCSATLFQPKRSSSFAWPWRARVCPSSGSNNTRSIPHTQL